jgi:hypothetical protein
MPDPGKPYCAFHVKPQVTTFGRFLAEIEKFGMYPSLMATPVSDLRDMLSREINVPGFPQLPDITAGQMDGYIADGFWETRLLGMLDDYTLTDGTEFATPPGPVIKKASNDGDLETQYQMLVVIMAGMKLIRLKALNLAVSFSAKAGPVEYEQQTSATVLRAILESLERRLKQLEATYSDLFIGSLHYFDGALQRERALIDGLADLSVY